jgi:hypothetical protein
MENEEIAASDKTLYTTLIPEEFNRTGILPNKSYESF